MEPNETTEQNAPESSVAKLPHGVTGVDWGGGYDSFVAVEYKPLEDITAYELARLLPLLLIKTPVTASMLEYLGSAARHLKRL